MLRRNSSAADPSLLLREHATHLVVFQHGLWGNTKDFRNFHTLFSQYFPQDEVYAHVAQCNATTFTQPFRTYDGMDIGGERLATEIMALAEEMPKLAKFSIAGHSLGGLYARYCIGVLYSRGFFENVEPMNFITLATPHMGIRRTERASLNVVHNSIAPFFFDLTGQQFTLKDKASEETLALSRPARRYPSKKSIAVYAQMDSVLLVRLPTQAGQDRPPDPENNTGREFQLMRCKLDDGILRLFSHQDPEHVQQGENPEPPPPASDSSGWVAEIDLLDAAVTIAVPDKLASSDSKQRSLTAPEFPEGCWDLEITGASSEQTFTLRIPREELPSQWKWIAALSNASHGVRCRSQGDTGSVKTAPAPTVLSCLTRGQFLQALQLFRARTLYSSIYNDFQVPYSCGAIRAFNPYRLETNPANEATSPYYRHIVLRSLWNAPLLRDTLPEDARALSERASLAGRFSLVKMLSDRHHFSRRRSSSSSSGSLHHVFSRSNSRTARAQTMLALTASSSSSQSLEMRVKRLTISGSSGSSSTTAPSAAAQDQNQTDSLRGSMFVSPFTSEEITRPVPFEDGLLLLDHADHAFETDDFRDDLRGMMVSLQSVGWRRIDVLFPSPMAHMKIIAMTATPAKPLTKGLDVVHHVMDTFLL